MVPIFDITADLASKPLDPLFIFQFLWKGMVAYERGPQTPQTFIACFSLDDVYQMEKLPLRPSRKESFVTKTILLPQRTFFNLVSGISKLIKKEEE